MNECPTQFIDLLLEEYLLGQVGLGVHDYKSTTTIYYKKNLRVLTVRLDYIIYIEQCSKNSLCIQFCNSSVYR